MQTFPFEKHLPIISRINLHRRIVDLALLLARRYKRNILHHRLFYYGASKILAILPMRLELILLINVEVDVRNINILLLLPLRLRAVFVGLDQVDWRHHCLLLLF